MKKIYPLLLLLLLNAFAKSQYVQKVTSINYYGFNGLNPSELTVFNNKLFFLGTDDPHYVNKLMYTDGTEAGVTVVKQIDTIQQYPSLAHLTVVNGRLVFNNSSQLWQSDGTAGGTSAIAHIRVLYPAMAVLGTHAFFSGDTGTSGYPHDQLWMTDGTQAGTTLVKTINPTGAAGIANMFTFNGNVYFAANDGVNNTQLWISDGTGAGTKLLKTIDPAGSYPSSFIAYNGKVYFTASDAVNGSQLWVTDGTTPGTMALTNANVAHYGMFPAAFTLYNSKLYFCAVDSMSFYQLWETDGTSGGTKTVYTNYTPRNGTNGFYPGSMAVHNNMLFMSGFDTITGHDQLWISDGTGAGTTRVTNYANGLFPGSLFSFQNRVIMIGYDSVSQQSQLFASDGTAEGTVCPTPPDTWGQYPFYPFQRWVRYNGAVYYRAAYAYFADYQLCRYSELPMGLTEQHLQHLTIYPNPTTGSFNITLPATINNATIDVYNSIGALVHHQSTSNTLNHVDLTGSPDGLYIITLRSNNQVIGTQKIIKQ